MVVACVAMAEYSGQWENDYGEDRQSPQTELPSGKLLPLNSKRVTNRHLKQICEALALPTTGSGDQMHQLIEGKLCSEEFGREPANIQVLVSEYNLVEVKLSLVDEGDVFLETSPVTKVSDLRADLSRQDEVADAREEVVCLKQQLEQEKMKKTNVANVLPAKQGTEGRHCFTETRDRPTKSSITPATGIRLSAGPNVGTIKFHTHNITPSPHNSCVIYPNFW